MIHNHRAVRIPAGRRANPKNNVVRSVRQRRHPEDTEHRSDEHPSQACSQIWGGRLGHDARL